MQLHDEHSLEDIPDFFDKWIDLSIDDCMYPPVKHSLNYLELRGREMVRY